MASGPACVQPALSGEFVQIAPLNYGVSKWRFWRNSNSLVLMMVSKANRRLAEELQAIKVYFHKFSIACVVFWQSLLCSYQPVIMVNKICSHLSKWVG